MADKIYGPGEHPGFLSREELDALVKTYPREVHEPWVDPKRVEYQRRMAEIQEQARIDKVERARKMGLAQQAKRRARKQEEDEAREAGYLE